MTEDFERFAGYLKLCDQMIEQASKDDIADTARVLALHLAHYRAQHGEIPLKKSFELLLPRCRTNLRAAAVPSSPAPAGNQNSRPGKELAISGPGASGVHPREAG